ncbi:serine O-acetyltransferase [Paracoccaceae bacterium]|nr:serine O-acetyltransferase [Paracoccaceae bacterium]
MRQDNIKIKKIWETIRKEAAVSLKKSNYMKDYFEKNILNHNCFSNALSYNVALKICNSDFELDQFTLILNEQISRFSHICDYAVDDLVAFYERDPACHWFYQPFLFYKGFIALQAHRIGNVLYNNGEIDLSLYLQMRVSEVFSIDIHPGATIGKGIMLDHAHNLVIGETAEIGNNVSILHAVTLGGTGKVRGNRHPKIGNNVLIGAGAKILGNISVGECSRVAAGSLVLKSVPSFKTVAGVPAKEVGSSGCPEPSKTMDQLLNRN